MLQKNVELGKKVYLLVSGMQNLTSGLWMREHFDDIIFIVGEQKPRYDKTKKRWINVSAISIEGRDIPYPLGFEGYADMNYVRCLDGTKIIFSQG